MHLNFFDNLCKTESSNVEFGLVDDIPNTSAYIDEVNISKWIAVVKNPFGKTVQFYGIDNCVTLKTVDGKTESSCDGVLKESQNLVFVELKERRSGRWFGDGRKQLTNTIKLFKENYNISEYTSIIAHVCNNLKPLANSSRAVAMEMFKDETGFILKDTMEIVV